MYSVYPYLVVTKSGLSTEASSNVHAAEDHAFFLRHVTQVWRTPTNQVVANGHMVLLVYYVIETVPLGHHINLRWKKGELL